MVGMWRCGMAAVLLIGLAPAAWAGGHKTIDMNNLNTEYVFPPGGYGESFTLSMQVEIVYNPGMSDKRGCRLQVYMTNTSKVKINMRTLLATSMSGDGSAEPDVADIDMVPTADLAPGQKVMRLYSCKPADTVTVPRDNVYTWPNICEINGEEQSPCPVELHFSSTMAVIEQK